MYRLHYQAIRTNFAGETLRQGDLRSYDRLVTQLVTSWPSRPNRSDAPAIRGGTLGTTFKSRLVSRNVTVDGHRTSLRLEQDVWDALEEVCKREGLNLHEVCTHVERRRSESSRTAAVRAFVLGYFREAASDSGHSRAGHGNLGVKDESDKPRLGASHELRTAF